MYAVAGLTWCARSCAVLLAVLLVLLLGSESWSAERSGVGRRVSLSSSLPVQRSLVVTSVPCSASSASPPPSAGSSYTDASGVTCIQGPVYDESGAQVVSLGTEDTTWIGMALALLVALTAAALVSGWGRDG